MDRRLLCIPLALGAAWVASQKTAAAADDKEHRPNIVFILADDLDVPTMEQLPALRGVLADKGTTFSNAFVSLSLCCPSRSMILRGQYAHETQVYGNKAPDGGFDKFHGVGDEESTVAVWLREGGYRTALMGKYLNGYPGTQDETYVPPGWDEWYSPAEGNPYIMYDYAMNENGRIVHYGHEPRDYMTNVLDDKAVSFIHRAARDRDKKPFFLYLATYAPHQPATPPPDHQDEFAHARVPRSKAYNEQDVADKPKWMNQFTPLLSREQGRIDTLYRKRLLSMLGVTDLVQDVVKALKNTGHLDDTYIVFTSDNGFHLGQHRLLPGKNTEFDTDLRVPMYIRGPGVGEGKTIDDMTVNCDFAPTFADWAGVAAPDFVSGRSLVPVLKGDDHPWRKAVLLEHAGPEALDDLGNPDFTGIHEPPDEAPPRHAGAGTNRVPVFVGVRTPEWKYIEYADGEQEVYDVKKDPDELDNLGGKTDKAPIGELKAWTKALVECKGAACREIEAHPPAAAP